MFIIKPYVTGGSRWNLEKTKALEQSLINYMVYTTYQLQEIDLTLSSFFSINPTFSINNYCSNY